MCTSVPYICVYIFPLLSLNTRSLSPSNSIHTFSLYNHHLFPPFLLTAIQLLLYHPMKQLIRRLSRVADSSQYSLLRSDSRVRSRRSESFRCLVKSARRASGDKPVPEGHVPVYVGDEMERFVVSAEVLNHPVFIGLLNKSAQEYGYDQKGVLRIPCHVLVFERVMEALRLGLEPRDLDDLLSSFFTDDYFS